ncbi:hypothetical protein [Chryseobacterium wanjuense]
MKRTLFLLFLAVSTLMMAQRVKVISGDYNFLKDQKFIKVVFKYDNMKFEKRT